MGAYVCLLNRCFILNPNVSRTGEYNPCDEAPFMNGSVFSLSKEVSYCDVKHRFSGHRSWITQNKYEGTFARVGVPNQANVISVGHSDYGLAEPAIDSAVSLALVTVFFFHSISNFDSKMYDRVIQKWLEKLIALYLNIEVTCFQQ